MLTTVTAILRQFKLTFNMRVLVGKVVDAFAHATFHFNSVLSSWHNLLIMT